MVFGLYQLVCYGQGEDRKKEYITNYSTSINKETFIRSLTNIVDLNSIQHEINYNDVQLCNAFVAKYNECKEYFENNKGSQVYIYDYTSNIFDIYKHPFEQTGEIIRKINWDIVSVGEGLVMER